MKTDQLPPLPTPKFTETIRGVPCITVTEHEHLMRAYALQARAQVQGEPMAEPAWFHKHWCDGDDIFYALDDKIPPGSTPLYTHPAAPSVPDAAIDSAIYNQCPDFDDWHEGPSIDDIRAIVRTAIQQAEAKTCEPIYQICKADSVSVHSAWVDVDKQAYDDAGLYPEYRRRMLYTRPATGVTDDVARDAERYRWLKDRNNKAQTGVGCWESDDHFTWLCDLDADAVIDAAMLAAQDRA